MNSACDSSVTLGGLDGKKGATWARHRGQAQRLLTDIHGDTSAAPFDSEQASARGAALGVALYTALGKVPRCDRTGLPADAAYAALFADVAVLVAETVAVKWAAKVETVRERSWTSRKAQNIKVAIKNK